MNDILQVTEELEKANRQIISILEGITEGFYALDNNWCFTYINKQAEQLYRLNKDLHIGQNIWSLFPMLVGSTLHVNYLDAKKDNTPRYFEMKGMYNSIWVEVRVYPSEEGISVFSRDITKRKRDEKELKLLKERFSKAFHTSLIAMTITTFDEGLFIDVNDSFLKIIGYKREEVIGKTLEELQILEKPYRNSLLRMFAQSGSVRDLEVVYRTKEGKITGLYNGELIELNGKKCILVMVADITDKKLMEQEIARLDRFNLIGQMAAGIGHEVRNPMTTVRGFLQIFANKKEYETDKEFLTLMINELDRANEIISEFLSLAKNKKIERNKLCINDILESLYPLLSADAIKSDVKINLHKGNIPKLLLDEKEIRQLIINLVRNSLEAMAEGGVVTLSTYLDSDEVVLTVQDEGCGIPLELLDKLGTPFLTTKDRGTGLGLSICYSIASRHNATVEVENCTKGTSFKIKFSLN